jgi:ribosomal protein L31E
MSDSLTGAVYEVIQDNHELTMSEIQRRSGVAMGMVVDIVRDLMKSKKVQQVTDNLGVIMYKRSASNPHQKMMKRNAVNPFTANPVIGAYVRGDNVVIKLGRMVHAKCVTIPLQDLGFINEMIAK